MWDSSQPGTYPKMASDLIRTATEVNIWYKCKEFEEVKFLCILEFKWKLNSSPNPASQPKSL